MISIDLPKWLQMIQVLMEVGSKYLEKSISDRWDGTVLVLRVRGVPAEIPRWPEPSVVGAESDGVPDHKDSASQAFICIHTSSDSS